MSDPDMECRSPQEFCTGCGREMVATEEEGALFDSDTGNRRAGRWHSCPRYFLPWWRAVLTLGTGGMGHDSHSADNRLLARRWK